jgi:uncharacterized protein (TIGR02646 family)
MRKITLQPPDDKKWKRWLCDCKKATDELHDLIAKGEELPNEFSKLYKRRKEFFLNKDSQFYGKCAYCECPIPGFQHGDIEHFRPKGEVTNEEHELIDHPGYYWLAYDWKNLLPACIACNQPTSDDEKKMGKRNRFPVIGQHAQNPDDIIIEQPMLINPASGNDEDDPSQHLAIDTTTGLMIGLSDRGEMCIKVFGLNDRDNLVHERRNACRAAEQLITSLIYSSDSASILREIQEIRQGKHSYSTAQNAVLSKYWSKLSQAMSPREFTET